MYIVVVNSRLYSKQSNVVFVFHTTLDPFFLHEKWIFFDMFYGKAKTWYIEPKYSPKTVRLDVFSDLRLSTLCIEYAYYYYFHYR